jgi:hypothetical protein
MLFISPGGRAEDRAVEETRPNVRRLTRVVAFMLGVVMKKDSVFCDRLWRA